MSSFGNTKTLGKRAQNVDRKFIEIVQIHDEYESKENFNQTLNIVFVNGNFKILGHLSPKKAYKF